MPILGVIALSLAGSIATSMRTGIATTEQDVAREAARGQMEEILGTEFDQVFTTWDQVAFVAGGLQAPGGGAPGLVTIDNTNPALLVVRVTVDWGGPFGTDQLELSTLLANVNPI